MGGQDNKKPAADLVLEVKENLTKALLNNTSAADHMENKNKASIYKIPEFIKEIQEKAFEPQFVSFGPYHNGKPRLKPMEVEKLKGFERFKTGNGLEVESIVKRVSNILEDLKESYHKIEVEDGEADLGKFLQIMVVDGCFMVDFFVNDCVDSLRNMSGDIKRDMLLLENQLPMVLLHVLYSLANNDQSPSQDLKSLICNSMGITDGVAPRALHILDMYRASLLYPEIDNKDRSGTPKKYDESDPECQIIPPATQLQEAGIKFERSKTESFTHVSFDPKRGVLSLPHVAVDDDSESSLLNVMAFEKLHVEAGIKVTSFVILMTNLIDAEKDVAVLAAEKILTNGLGNDRSAAELFSVLGKGASMDLDSHMTKVHKMVNEHCNQPWNKWCASLKQDYFQNPWAFISLVAASLGFVILLLQAVYQLFDYYLK